MEILINLNTDSILNCLKYDYKNNSNIQTFITDIENNYFLFEKVIKFLSNLNLDLTLLIDFISNRELFIIDKNELKEIGFKAMDYIKLTENKYIVFDYSIRYIDYF